VALVTGVTAMRPAPDGDASTVPASAVPASSASPAARSAAAAFGPVITPDLLVIMPSGLTAAQRARLARLPGVRGVVTADGASIQLGAGRVNALGVDPRPFRSWTPLATASDQRLWTALEQGRFVASSALAGRLRLAPAHRYQLGGAARKQLGYGGSASLGISGIGLLVSTAASAGLGLIPRVLAMVSAPSASIGPLTTAVRRVTGRAATVISLRPQQQQLPVDHAAAGRPANYLQLFQAAAARYCPGLSWTVLAAIGQIESGDGANMGPSSAGALGPMQFLPSTWAAWGITAFGETSAPNIMDPYDAVPAAARMLCADGAGSPGGVRGAIFAYNHATWYVDEVLALAQQYARDYG
jgi:Transglycosylase SLT domain